MKTGFVCASGFNLIGSATRDGRTLIAVVLGAKSQQERAEIAADLMADGFAKAGTGTVALAELKPEGEGNGKARDMRSVVCTDKAQSERWDGREVEGKITFKSPHIKPMLREPKLVAITTGGAIGPVAPQAEALFRVEVPIPTPRPDRAAPQKQAAADTGSGGGAPEATAGGKLRPTLAAPLPDPAPRELN
jgi:D-alanyl-D-alanine carboxypeptidase